MSDNRLKLNTEKIEPLRAGYVRYMALQTQIRRDCHSEQTDVFLRRDGVCPELERWTADSHRGLTVSCTLVTNVVGRQRLRSATQQLMVVPQHRLSTVGLELLAGRPPRTAGL